MAKKLVIIGGGAAGFFCAVNAARLHKNLQVVLLEKTNKLLSKVKVSGGGRCNVTHALFDIAEMSKKYPRGQNFVKKTFHQFFTTDTIKWFEERGLALKAESDGRMFPVTDNSQSVIDCLMKEAERFHVDIKTNSEVHKIVYGNKKWMIELRDYTELQADFICIASGGFAKASQFGWLTELGHSFSAPVPSLFTFNLPGHPISKLMGISVEKVKVKIEGTKLNEEGPLLITHWGISGPAVLRLSAWGARELEKLQYIFSVHINWLPEMGEQKLREEISFMRNSFSSKKIYQHNFTSLPARLWQFLLDVSGIKQEWRFADLPGKAENTWIRNLTDYTVDVKGKTTFKEEFVTAGGIQLNEIDANTMKSKLVPDLFFAGEIMDVDGITGGFNFQHAWTSAYIAAAHIQSA